MRDMVAELLAPLPKQGFLFPGRRKSPLDGQEELGPFNGFSKGMAEFRKQCAIDHCNRSLDPGRPASHAGDWHGPTRRAASLH